MDIDTVNYIIILTISGLIGARLFVGARMTEEQVERKHRIEKFESLSQNLRSATLEIEGIISDLAENVKKKDGELMEVEAMLEVAKSKHAEIEGKIAVLKEIPLPVAEYFTELVNAIEKRSAARDYILFGSGLVAGAVINLVLKRFGLS